MRKIDYRCRECNQGPCVREDVNRLPKVCAGYKTGFPVEYCCRWSAFVHDDSHDIYAIDFDGTIVENKWPEIGALKPEARAFIEELQERGDKWILLTMRDKGLLERAVEFLKKNGLFPDAVNDNLKECIEAYGNNPRKVFAHVYIDDHNAGGLQWRKALYEQKGEK